MNIGAVREGWIGRMYIQSLSHRDKNTLLPPVHCPPCMLRHGHRTNGHDDYLTPNDLNPLIFCSQQTLNWYFINAKKYGSKKIVETKHVIKAKISLNVDGIQKCIPNTWKDL